MTQNQQRHKSLSPFKFDSKGLEEYGRRSGVYIGKNNQQEYYDGFSRYNDYYSPPSSIIIIDQSLDNIPEEYSIVQNDLKTQKQQQFDNSNLTNTLKRKSIFKKKNNTKQQSIFNTINKQQIQFQSISNKLNISKNKSKYAQYRQQLQKQGYIERDYVISDRMENKTNNKFITKRNTKSNQNQRSKNNSRKNNYNQRIKDDSLRSKQKLALYQPKNNRREQSLRRRGQLQKKQKSTDKNKKSIKKSSLDKEQWIKEQSLTTQQIKETNYQHFPYDKYKEKINQRPSKIANKKERARNFADNKLTNIYGNYVNNSGRSKIKENQNQSKGSEYNLNKQQLGQQTQIEQKQIDQVGSKRNFMSSKYKKRQRQSKRVHLSPMKYWQNEKIIYNKGAIVGYQKPFDGKTIIKMKQKLRVRNHFSNKTIRCQFQIPQFTRIQINQITILCKKIIIGYRNKLQNKGLSIMIGSQQTQLINTIQIPRNIGFDIINQNKQAIMVEIYIYQ